MEDFQQTMENWTSPIDDAGNLTITSDSSTGLYNSRAGNTRTAYMASAIQK